MRKIALLGAAGVIGLSGLAAGQTVTPNPPGTDSSAASAHERASPAQTNQNGRGGRHRPSAVESLDADTGAVTGSGAPTSRRNKFVRDGAVSGVTTGLGAETSASTAGATSSGITTGGSRSATTSGSSGSSSGVTSASGASGATSGSSASFVGSVTHGVTGVTSGSGSQGGSAGGNSGPKGGKGKGK